MDRNGAHFVGAVVNIMDEEYLKAVTETHRHIARLNTPQRIAPQHTASQRTASQRTAPHRTAAEQSKARQGKAKQRKRERAMR